MLVGLDPRAESLPKGMLADAGASSLLKKGTGSEPPSGSAAKNPGREVPVPFLQQAARWHETAAAYGRFCRG